MPHELPNGRASTLFDEYLRKAWIWRTIGIAVIAIAAVGIIAFMWTENRAAQERQNANEAMERELRPLEVERHRLQQELETVKTDYRRKFQGTGKLRGHKVPVSTPFFVAVPGIFHVQGGVFRAALYRLILSYEKNEAYCAYKHSTVKWNYVRRVLAVSNSVVASDRGVCRIWETT